MQQATTFTYSLENSANGRFSIDSHTGVISVAGSIDFEETPSLTIRVKAISQDGSASNADFTIAVLNENERPTASNRFYRTSYIDPLIIDSPGLLSNATDPEGDILHVELVVGPAEEN